MRALKVFFCYAREDESLFNKLKKYLSPLRGTGSIEEWHDRSLRTLDCGSEAPKEHRLEGLERHRAVGQQNRNATSYFSHGLRGTDALNVGLSCRRESMTHTIHETRHW